MTFNYRRLKAERVARKISQDEMADKLGMKPWSYRRRENGLIDIGADELGKIANVLGIDDLSIFFDKTGTNENGKEI